MLAWLKKEREKRLSEKGKRLLYGAQLKTYVELKH
jgi:hypothetical protein